MQNHFPSIFFFICEILHKTSNTNTKINNDPPYVYLYIQILLIIKSINKYIKNISNNYILAFDLYKK